LRKRSQTKKSKGNTHRFQLKGRGGCHTKQILVKKKLKKGPREAKRNEKKMTAWGRKEEGLVLNPRKARKEKEDQGGSAQELIKPNLLTVEKENTKRDNPLSENRERGCPCIREKKELSKEGSKETLRRGNYALPTWSKIKRAVKVPLTEEEILGGNSITKNWRLRVCPLDQGKKPGKKRGT